MKIYKITNIEEADYGCEESAGARALVTMTNGDIELKTELSEEWIALSGIDIGKSVVLGDDGKYRPII
ncbi:MAG: hypothetical protein IJR45_03115 [Firmicutes bacterium]|nr:hypothetical protein [Bacillota bacterium]MBQ9604383.1 hypothetical protein [Bacillota bacterium]